MTERLVMSITLAPTMLVRKPGNTMYEKSTVMRTVMTGGTTAVSRVMTSEEALSPDGARILSAASRISSSVVVLSAPPSPRLQRRRRLWCYVPRHSAACPWCRKGAATREAAPVRIRGWSCLLCHAGKNVRLSWSPAFAYTCAASPVLRCRECRAALNGTCRIYDSN